MGYLSEMNGTTPKELSDLLGEVREAGQGSAVSGIAGVGYGRMTISQVVEREGLELSAAMERLSSAGIRAGKKDNLRTLATDHGLTPLELVDIMKGS
jgi:phage-related minor tail protein